MFFTPQDGHGLPHDPLSAIVSPRPIGWISSRDAQGRDNLAPYSFFNMVAYKPPQVVFATTSAKADRSGAKDTLANVRETGAFCVNVTSWDLREAMNATSASLPAGADEFAHAGLAREECRAVACARVAGAPAALECRLTQVVRLAGEANWAAFGEVVGVHLRPDILRDGIVDVTRYAPLGRLGYRGDYVAVRDTFEMARPR